MSLVRYKKKRNFSQTSEPSGAKPSGRSGRRFLYVIQKHAARRLHYDFRLELEGVLTSWALPKGVPFVQGEKRLAVHVEDHPVEYANFEGIIPPGNYGAGTVMVWDAGICESSEEDPVRALEKGKLSFHLEGQKLKGHWAIVRIRPRGDDGEENTWLIIKTEESARPLSARAEDRSAVTSRSMKQIAADGDRTWQSNRSESNAEDPAPKRAVRPQRSRKPKPSVARR